MANVFAQFVDDAPQENVFAQFVAESKDTPTTEQDVGRSTKGIVDEGDIHRGFDNTFRQLPQIGYGLTAIAGATGEKVFGEGGISTGIKKAGLEGYQEASANMEQHSKPSDSLTYSWDRAKEGHFGDLADWVQHGIGYAGGQGLQMLATAGFGNVVAKEGVKAFATELTAKMVASEAAKIGAADAVKVAANTGITAMTAEAIQQAAVKGVASKIGGIGANTAMGGMALGMEGGEIGGDLVTKAQERGTPLTGTELAQGFGATLGAGALEFVGDKFGLDILTGKSKLYKALGSAPGLGGRVGRGVAAGAIAGIPEAATEYGQTLTEEYGKGNDPFSAEAKQQAFDAAGQGAIGGHVMGLAGGLLTPPQPKTPEEIAAELLARQQALADTASTGPLGNALATGGIANTDVAPDTTSIDGSLLDTRTPEQTAQDEQALVATNQNESTALSPALNTLVADEQPQGLQSTPNPADAIPSTLMEDSHGSQESTDEERPLQAEVQERPLLNNPALEQSGVTSTENTHDQLPSAPDIQEQSQSALGQGDLVTPENTQPEPLASEAVAPHEIAAKNTQAQLPAKIYDSSPKVLGGLSVRGFVADKVNENTQFSEDNGKFYLGDTDAKQQVTKAVHTYGQAYQTHLTDAYNAQDNTEQDSPVPMDINPASSGNEITPTVGENGSDVLGQEVVKQPSSTQATESVDNLPETGALATNDQAINKQPIKSTIDDLVTDFYVKAAWMDRKDKEDEWANKFADKLAEHDGDNSTKEKYLNLANELIKTRNKDNSYRWLNSPHIMGRIELSGIIEKEKALTQQSPEATQTTAEVHSKLDSEIDNLSATELEAVAKELGVKTSQFNNGESAVKQQHPDDISAALDKVKSNSANVDADSGNFGPIHREFYHDVDGAIAKLTELQDGEAIAALHHPEVGNIDLVWGKEGTAKSDGYGLAKLIKYHPEVLSDLQGLLLTLTKNEKRSTDRRIQLESKDHQDGIKLDWDGKQKTWLLTAFEKRTGNNTSTDTIDITGKDDTARSSSSLDKSITPSPENATGNEEKLTTKGTALADKATDNIQDFGEKLEGAKKHTYTFKEDLTTDIDVSVVPLSKSFPQPDYDKLIAGGTAPQTAAVIAHLRAQIPTKPKTGYKLKSWAEKVEALRGFATQILEGDVPSQKVIDSITLIGSHGKHLAAMFEIADSILPSQIKALGDFGIEERHYHLYEGRSNVTKWAATAPKQRTALFDTKEEALAYIKEKVTDTTTTLKGEALAKFDIWTERGKPGITFVGKKVAAGKFITLKEFTSIKAARDYVANHNAELVELLKDKKKTKDVRRSENNQRVGKDYRNGKNIDAEQFTKTFGFFGVQFGNWVNNDRRQQDLNNAYDGLMDLADVLGIPPKALALNGQLGLAFGARGSGGEHAAAAHYEPKSTVINLTKANGAGSLAHEWWHAVDNYFGKQESDGFLSDKGARRAQILEGNKYRPSTEADFAVRKAVFDAWQGVTKAIKTETQLVRRSTIKDKTRSKDYYSTVIEMTARSFERYIIGKLEDQGYSNDYLANIIPESSIDAQEKIEESDYPFPLQSEMEAVNKAYDKLFDTLETKETEQGTAIYEPKKEYGISETGADNTNDAGWRNNALQRPQVINTKTSIIKTGLTEVNSPQDALHVISSFSNYAQEQMVALVLGANNKVLQIVRHTAGLNDSSMVDPGVLAGSIHGIKGAKSVYFAHNHPSGKANQSKADRDITDKLTELLRGTGIESKGMLVTVIGNEGTFYNSDEHVEDIDITETHAERTKNIPVTERHLISNTKIATESITGEDIAVRVANIIASGREGVLLLDNQNTPVSFVEITIDDMNRLRTNKTGTGASLLLKEIHETNARAMMMVVPKPNYALSTYADIAKNLGAFANNTGHTRMLDGIIGRESLMAQGHNFDRNTPYFSKATSEVSNPHTKSSLHAAITKALDKVFGQGWTQRLEATGKFKMISAAEAVKLIGADSMFHKVFHGSPHDHNGFDSNHIDSGEGAQAFGWGHYFSDLKTVAEWYRKGVSTKQLIEIAKDSYHEYDSVSDAANAILENPELSAPQKELILALQEDDWLGFDYPHQAISAAVLHPEQWELSDRTKKAIANQGKLYEVDLAPSQEEYLDWNKSLSEQSDLVKEAINKALQAGNMQGHDNETLSKHDIAELDGEALYKSVTSALSDDKAASQYLNTLGIRGIRYKAEHGRSDASNYVVFNDADINIEAKYSKDGQVLAFYNPADDTSYFVHDNISQDTSAKALLGLVLHEVAVHALQMGKTNEAFQALLKRFEAMKATNPKVQAAFDRVPSDTKAKDKLEEALAYFIEHNADSSLAQRIVEAFRQLVRAIGNNIKGMDKLKFMQWANKLTETELRNMAVSALKNAPSDLQFDNVGREAEGVKLSQSAMKSVVANIKRGREAMTQALLNKSTVHRAMFRQGMGWVDFEWGDEGGEITPKGKRPGAKGIAHIIEARQRKDGLSNQEARSLLFDLVDTIAKGEEVNRYESGLSTSLKINYLNHQVLLARRNGANAWMVTGFKMDEPVDAGSGYDAPTSTQSVSTLTRNEVGAGSKTISQQDDNSSDNIKFSRSTPTNTPSDNESITDKLNNAFSQKNIDTAIYQFQDKYIDLKRKMQSVVKNGGAITEIQDARTAEELYHKRLSQRNEDFLKDELNPILKGLHSAGITMAHFQTFLHAQHAPSRNKVMAQRNPNQTMIDEAITDITDQLEQLDHQSAPLTTEQKAEHKDLEKELKRWTRATPFQGTEEDRLALSGMSNTEASAFINGLSAQDKQAMTPLAKLVYAINNKTLDLQVSYGLENQDTIDGLRSAWDNYVPLHRDEAHPDSYSHPIGSGFSVKGSAFKNALGSNSEVTNILTHIAMAREQALVRGEKLRVEIHLANLLTAHPDPDFATVGKVPTVDTLVNGFKETNIDPSYRNKPNYVMMRLKGKDIGIEFNERNESAVRLALALKNLDGVDLDKFESFFAKGTRWMSAVNTQYNLVFGIMNLMRDVSGGAINLSSTPLAGKQAQVMKAVFPALQAIYGIERGLEDHELSALYKEYGLAGATTGFRDLFADVNDRKKAIIREFERHDDGMPRKTLMAIGQWLSDFNTAMENAVRLATYKVARESGLSIDKSASIAKNITVNFNRKGAATTKIGAFYAFFNASMQGSARMIETLSGPSGKKIIASGVALGAISTLIGMAAMGDDDWDKIPEHIRERNLIIPNLASKGDYFAIPLPLGFNILPNIGRKTVEAAFGSNRISKTQRFGELLGSIIGTFNPLGGGDVIQALTPTVADPAVALIGNKDWTGKTIYKEDFNALNPTPGFTRAKSTATTPSKLLAEGLNKITGGTDYKQGAWSPTPDQIDYIFAQLTGGTGRELMHIEELAASLSNDQEVPMYKIPLLGKLYGETSSNSVERGLYYENVKRINAHHEEIDGLRAETNGGSKVNDYLNENPEAGLIGSAKFINKSIDRLNKSKKLQLKNNANAASIRTIDDKIAKKMKLLNDKMLEVNQ